MTNLPNPPKLPSLPPRSNPAIAPAGPPSKPPKVAPTILEPEKRDPPPLDLNISRTPLALFLKASHLDILVPSESYKPFLISSSEISILPCKSVTGLFILNEFLIGVTS